MTQTSSVRVVVADDQDLVRAGIRAILEAEPDLEVVAEAADGRAAAAAAREHRADVVLMDVEMPGVGGVEGVELVARARPETRVVMLTTFDLDEYVAAALRAGACGFLLKTSPPQQLVSAVRGAVTGQLPLAPSVTRRMVDSWTAMSQQKAGGGSAVPEELTHLTERELDVLRCLARGLSNAEIGSELFLGEATVKTHVTRILTKLGVRDRVQAVVRAHQVGLT